MTLKMLVAVVYRGVARTPGAGEIGDVPYSAVPDPV